MYAMNLLDCNAIIKTKYGNELFMRNMANQQPLIFSHMHEYSLIGDSNKQHIIFLHFMWEITGLIQQAVCRVHQWDLDISDCRHVQYALQ